MITYEEYPIKIAVKLEGKVVGHIEPIGKGYHYLHKSQKDGGQTFSTIQAVKNSIEGK